MTRRSVVLCEFEIEVLRMLDGSRPQIRWGAAVGAALGILKGARLVSLTNGCYAITDEGRKALEDV